LSFGHVFGTRLRQIEMTTIQFDLSSNSNCTRRYKICQTLIFTGLKEARPAVFGRSQKEGQLKERSEGDQAQWQTALGEVLAAGS
jgi:hypothetical protein